MPKRLCSKLHADWSAWNLVNLPLIRRTESEDWPNWKQIWETLQANNYTSNWSSAMRQLSIAALKLIVVTCVCACGVPETTRPWGIKRLHLRWTFTEQGHCATANGDNYLDMPQNLLMPQLTQLDKQFILQQEEAVLHFHCSVREFLNTKLELHMRSGWSGPLALLTSLHVTPFSGVM